MGSGNGGFLLAVTFLLLVALIGFYDLYALWYLPPENTVSWFLRLWSRDFPGLPLFLGFVLGHLYFPLPR